MTQLELWEGASAPQAAPADARTHALARALPSGVRLGTSSWSFPGWRGLVYAREASRQALAREGLVAYARHPLLRCVGLDRTYYAPPELDDLRRYAGQVPDDFRFVVKAPEVCTLARFPQQPRHGARAGQPNPLFLDPAFAAERFVGPVVEGLGERAGVLVFQFPPQAGPRAGELASRLGAFLHHLPRGPRYAVEIRRSDWLTPGYAAALRAAGASHCLTVHPSMPELTAQLELAVAEDAPALIVRWMLGDGRDYEAARERYAPFDRLVDEDPASRAAIAAQCVRFAARGRPVFVTVNNKAEGSAPLSIARLAEQIASAPARRDA